MTSSTSIIVPPYHVQSTAADLRDGFPYFAYHDSISALWSTRWRTPCQHGIYPFTDANVDDFDPIFAELIRLSGDQSAFLYRPDDYAEAVPARGREDWSRRRSRPRRKRTWRRRATCICAPPRCTGSRVFRSTATPVSQAAWERGKDAYAKGRPVSQTRRALPLTCPFAHADTSAGDADRPIQGLSAHAHWREARLGGWPVALVHLRSRRLQDRPHAAYPDPCRSRLCDVELRDTRARATARRPRTIRTPRTG